MNITKALYASTAILALSTGAALAGNGNTGVVEQLGDNNTAFIEQDGDDNRVGRSDRVGLALTGYYGKQYRVIQSGDSNKLEITQIGNKNLATGGHSGNLQDSLFQTGDGNAISVTQTNQGTSYDGNAIFRIYQDSDEGTGVANKLTIEQGNANQSSRNLIRRVQQNSTGAAADNEITVTQGTTIASSIGYYSGGNFLYALNQSGGGNELTITQDGRNNFVDTVAQTGHDNAAKIDQTGNKNVIASLTQNGNENTATVALTGDNNGGTAGQNGSAPWSGANTNGAAIGPYTPDIYAFSAGSRAEGVGIAQGVLLQEGSYNTLNHAAVGNNNLLAVQQLNDSNSYVGTVAGSGNEIAVLQNGVQNNASINLSGSYNNVGVKSVGNGNTADVTHDGSSNQNSVLQNGTGNTATVNVSGSSNNAGSFGSGVAGVLANAANLAPGLLVQTGPDALTGGTGNTVTLTVRNNSNNNLFASLQSGNLNTITVTQEGAGGNQAAVVQNGNSNLTALSQVGSGNNASIQQGALVAFVASSF